MMFEEFSDDWTHESLSDFLGFLLTLTAVMHLWKITVWNSLSFEFQHSLTSTKLFSVETSNVWDTLLLLSFLCFAEIHFFCPERFNWNRQWTRSRHSKLESDASLCFLGLWKQSHMSKCLKKRFSNFEENNLPVLGGKSTKNFGAFGLWTAVTFDSKEISRINFCTERPMISSVDTH